VIRSFRHPFVLALLAIALVVVPETINVAGTSAANYHWAREQSKFRLRVGDNVSGNWNKLLRSTLRDWNKNDTVTLDGVGDSTNPRDCRPVTAGLRSVTRGVAPGQDVLAWRDSTLPAAVTSMRPPSR
jgi:hypothetical protein